MKTYLTKAELKLMEVIWEKGQIPSNKLVKECLERFNWKKSTTYTNLKKLCRDARLRGGADAADAVSG